MTDTPRELILKRPGCTWHLVRAPRGAVAVSLCGRRREGDGWTVAVCGPEDHGAKRCGHCYNVKVGKTYQPAREDAR